MDEEVVEKEINEEEMVAEEPQLEGLKEEKQKKKYVAS